MFRFNYYIVGMRLRAGLILHVFVGDVVAWCMLLVWRIRLVVYRACNSWWWR